MTQVHIEVIVQRIELTANNSKQLAYYIVLLYNKNTASEGTIPKKL